MPKLSSACARSGTNIPTANAILNKYFLNKAFFDKAFINNPIPNRCIDLLLAG